MEAEIKARLTWVKLYEETKNAGYVCRHCGISRPTLRKWVSRYKDLGEAGLNNQSKRPINSPNRKVDESIKIEILALRKRNLGARRIQSQLLRQNNLSLSLATIHKILKSENMPDIRKLKRKKKFKKYSRPIPGDRVQVDTCKIAHGIYQYTAVDDCSRWRVLKIYTRATAKNTLDFIDIMCEEFPFAIQRIQTDRGREFFAFEVQRKLMSYGIKFRPNKPGCPHLNGKVERSQKTDLEEFYALADLSDFDALQDSLSEWQMFYNWHRPHGSLKGLSPTDIVNNLKDKTLLWDEVNDLYDPKKEHIQEPVYAVEMAMRKLKPCL